MIAQNSKIDIAPLNLIQIYIVGLAVFGRNIFEQKHIGYEPAKKRIMGNELFNRTAFLCEFFFRMIYYIDFFYNRVLDLTQYGHYIVAGAHSIQHGH